jgi:hypothetical protein
LRCVLTVFSHRPGAFLRVIRLMVLGIQLCVIFHAGSRAICHSFLNHRLCFGKFSRTGISLLMSESVILLVAILYVEAIEAVKSRTALSAPSSELFWILGKINSEAKRWNRSQSVNLSTGSENSYFQYDPASGK